MKYSSKRSAIFKFYLYLCHVIDDFACLELQHQDIVRRSYHHFKRHEENSYSPKKTHPRWCRES